MGKNILIAGGSGLTGTEIRHVFEKHGDSVAVLTRSTKNKACKAYYWDYEKEEIDEEAIQFADIIINLTGENISSGKWTLQKKVKIINSRVLTTNLLFDKIKSSNKKPESFISASAIGYYGTYTSDKIFTEEMPAGNDFLATTVKLWEDSVENINLLDIRTVKLRIGVVLSNLGGAYPKLMKTVKRGFASAVGSGNQYMPWIHIKDLAEMFYFFAYNKDLNGIYNAVSPEFITNNEFMKGLARQSNKPYFMPKVPSIVIRSIFGEMSSILLKGSRVSSEKIQNAGFKFSFPDILSASEDLIKPKSKSV